MKIDTITIRGFRGFNSERTIICHPQLTLIYGKNSYGKTSISEALEWLIYGATSKVEKADSKEEYKDSYRNQHYPEGQIPYVRVAFVEAGNEMTFEGHLEEGDTLKRVLDGKKDVSKWPFLHEVRSYPRPFILQHTLKYLLLVKPDERFQAFARLVGLEELENIQHNVISLCTKPDARIPAEVSQVKRNVQALEARLASQSSLTTIQKALKKGFGNLTEAYEVTLTECKKRLPPGTREESILPQLLKVRDEAVGKVFKGRIVLSDYSESERGEALAEETALLNQVTTSLVSKYAELTGLAAADYTLKRAKFFELGIELFETGQGNCPFCEQTVDNTRNAHIRAEHAKLHKDLEQGKKLDQQRREVTESIEACRKKLVSYNEKQVQKVSTFLLIESSLTDLGSIIGTKYPTQCRDVQNAIKALSESKASLNAEYQKVTAAIDGVVASISAGLENVSLMKDMGGGLASYIAVARGVTKVVLEHSQLVTEAGRVLKHEVDVLAGTQDVSLLIDLLEHWSEFKKKLRIDAILDNLKEFRKAIDKYVADKMLELISGELTSEVMSWYQRIQTTGDPDVHFAGFDLERTAEGEAKGRRVRIKAESYGAELVSAVSSLSESKLNALGLCVSIASNVKGQTPFEFLVIDDPIQSWDEEHETQFIEVIRELLALGKQVILLSHNKAWLEQVRTGLRSVNGAFYEITSYTQDGPNINEQVWCSWTQRLVEVHAIIQNTKAGDHELQRGEGELRFAVNEITVQAYHRVHKIKKSVSRLNTIEVRSMLQECGVEATVLDKISEMLQKVSDAHHAGSTYSGSRERLRTYHQRCHELAHKLGMK